MDDYKKLKLKKKDDKGYMGSAKVIVPSGLKLKRAKIEVDKLSDEELKPKPFVKGSEEPKSYRDSLEAETNAMSKDAMKEAMEKARLKRAMKERQMIKRIK